VNVHTYTRARARLHHGVVFYRVGTDTRRSYCNNDNIILMTVDNYYAVGTFLYDCARSGLRPTGVSVVRRQVIVLHSRGYRCIENCCSAEVIDLSLEKRILACNNTPRVHTVCQ